MLRKATAKEAEEQKKEKGT